MSILVVCGDYATPASAANDRHPVTSYPLVSVLRKNGLLDPDAVTSYPLVAMAPTCFVSISISGVNLVQSLGGRKKFCLLPNPQIQNFFWRGGDGEKLTVSWN